MAFTRNFKFQTNMKCLLEEVERADHINITVVHNVPACRFTWIDCDIFDGIVDILKKKKIQEI